jgi:hypothetical protein
VAKRQAKVMSPEELREFLLRQQTLVAAQNTYALLDQANKEWLRGVGRKYRVGTRFEVNPETGEIAALPKDDREGAEEVAHG